MPARRSTLADLLVGDLSDGDLAEGSLPEGVTVADFDAIVVGAGPAGSAAAIELAAPARRCA